MGLPRARLLSEPAKVFGNHDPSKRDLLLEYFVPMDQFSIFVKKAASIIQQEYDSLLNVTVREIAKRCGFRSSIRPRGHVRLGHALLYRSYS